MLRPSIETTAGYDSNAERVPRGRGSATLAVAPELLVRSDWSRHELAAVLRGTYSWYEAVPALDRPTFEGRVQGRVDITHDTRADIEGRFLLGTDYPGSPDVAVGFSRLPIYTDIGGTLGFAQRFNRLELAIKGMVDRFDYRPTEFTDGTSLDSTDRNYTQYATVARASYELTPGVKPFVEGTYDIRRRELPVDRFGIHRDSEGSIGRVGSTFELTRTLTGELSVGYSCAPTRIRRCATFRG
jgi:hypothetical protein